MLEEKKWHYGLILQETVPSNTLIENGIKLHFINFIALSINTDQGEDAMATVDWNLDQQLQSWPKCDVSYSTFGKYAPDIRALFQRQKIPRWIRSNQVPVI